VLGRKVSIGFLVAILGVSAIPAASYSTTATEIKETGANAGNLPKALKACRKDKSIARRRRCEDAVLSKPGSTGVVRWWAKNDLLNRVW
jgi:hypothetical protein